MRSESSPSPTKSSPLSTTRRRALLLTRKTSAGTHRIRTDQTRRFRQLLRWVRPVDLTFMVAAGALVVIRLQILHNGGAPATIDAGNWIAFGEAIFGNTTRSSTIVYPPVVPILTKGFVEAFGLINGIAALGALASIAPATGLYVALRRYGVDAEALPGAILVLGASAVGETTAWGGFPQLIGLGLASLFLFELDRALRTRSRGDAGKAGVVLMLLLATSHFIGFAVVVMGGLILLFDSLWPRERRLRLDEAIGGAALILVPSVWLIPTYLDLAGALVGASDEFGFLTQLTWSNLPERIEFIYRDFPTLWRVALPLTALTPLLLAKLRTSSLWRVLAAMVVAAAGLALVTRVDRFFYFATVAVALATTLWIQSAGGTLQVHSRRSRRAELGRRVMIAARTIALGLAVWQVVVGALFFQEQRDYYGILTPGLYQGLIQIRDATPQDTVLAVTSVRDAPLGWWVEAITDRRTYYASALRWLSFDDELERARIGNQIFTRTFPDSQSINVALEHGVDYLIVPTRWAFYDVDLLGESSSAWARAFFAAGDVVILPASAAIVP